MSATLLRPSRVHRGVPDGCPLTPNELHVLTLFADGLNAKQIALQRDCALSTVRTQLHTAYRRLGVTGAAHAAIHCFKAGWLRYDGNHVTAAPATQPVRVADRVTTAQALYLDAFQRWLRTHDPADREEMRVMTRIIRRQGSDLASQHQTAVRNIAA